MEKVGKTLRIFTVLLALPASASVYAQNKVAQRYLDAALSNCEKGLQAGMPQSPVALTVLQRYEKKYLRYKDAALSIAPDLAESDSAYQGETLNGKSYREAITTCETELPDKTQKAADTIDKKRKQARERALEQAKTQAEREQLAVTDAVEGIRNYCFRYTTLPTIQTLTADAEGKLSLDKATFGLVRDKAAELWAEVGQSQQSLTFTDAQGREQSAQRPLGEWYAYCDKVFADYESALADVRTKHKEMEEAGLLEEGVPGDEEVPTDEEMPADDMPEDTEGDAVPDDDEAPADDGAPDDEEPPVDDAAPDDDEAPADDTAPDDEEPPVDDAAPDDEEPPVDDAAPDDEEPPADDNAPVNEEPPVDDNAPVDAPPAEDNAPVSGETPVDDAVPDNSEDAEGDADADYFKELRGQVKGDRLKALDETGRVPDYTGNDEDAEKAKVWMYEDADSGRCQVYTFTGDKLKSKKALNECPI